MDMMKYDSQYHLTNALLEDAPSVARRLTPKIGESLRIGDPVGTDSHSADELRNTGFVGIYAVPFGHSPQGSL